MTKVGINGFGRIGRQLLQAILQFHDQALEVAAINDIISVEERAYLLRHDTVYGAYRGTVRTTLHDLVVDNKPISQIGTYRGEEPPDWARMDVEMVIDASGQVAKVGLHLQGGAKIIIVTAPHEQADITLIYGVNHSEYDPSKHCLISAASCTTICAATVLKTLERFGLRRAYLDSVNAYTNEQRLVDSHHDNPRRARAAAANIIPTESSTDRTIMGLFPGLCFSGRAFRVPVLCGSVCSLWIETAGPLTASEVDTALREEARLKPTVLGYSLEPLVSSDIIGSTQAAVVDGLLTKVSGPWVHVVAWYDNERGHASQVAELAAYIGKVGIA